MIRCSFRERRTWVEFASCSFVNALHMQAVFAGIGNWMGDETLYQSFIFPEQPANTLTEDQVWVT